MTILYSIILICVFAIIGALFYTRRTMSLPVEVIDHIPADPKEEMIVPEIITPDLMSNVSDEEIEAAFATTHLEYGHLSRERLTKSVLRVAVGKYCGITITCIMRSLGLIGQHRQGRDPVLTKKGREYLQTALHKQL
jgi:hypothetical protein